MRPTPRPRPKVRVLIIEDHTLFAESIELALTIERYDVRRLRVAELGTSQRALLSAAVRLAPDIVLLDLDLGRMGDGVRLIAPLTQAGARIIVVTASPDEGRHGQCLHHGARTVLSKSVPLNEVLATVRRINEGIPVMDPAERSRLLARWVEERQQLETLRDRLESLTQREREVLGQLIEGHSVTDVARASVVSVATVRTQVKSILAKLGVSSQLAAVGVAHRVGWQPPEHGRTIHG
jgi:two-component system, NarL family, nitrate/nitrite response regulator NarL